MGRLPLPRGASIGACFAADEGRLVAGGGAKAAGAYRWAIGDEEAYEEDGPGIDSTGTSADGERKAKGKQPHRRMAKSQKRIPCRLANR